MPTDLQLKRKVDALCDRFWSGGIANPITAIEQMSYLIFLKRLEDISFIWQFSVDSMFGTISCNRSTPHSILYKVFAWRSFRRRYMQLQPHQ